MSTNLRNVALIWAVPILSGIALATGLAWLRAPDSTAAAAEAAKGPVQKWAKVSVELPTSHSAFPPGNGADIANGQCLICHSAGMVLRQPPLTLDEWTGEINKMRNAFGAPLPADQVGPLAKYLQGINGRQQSPKGPSAVDGQGS
jgi:mono/diheme cytochrome c family protein